MNHKGYRLAVIIIFIFTALSASPAVPEVNTRLFDSDDIISSDYSSFCLDRNNTLWIGTQSGLTRFDGTNSDKYLYDENCQQSLSDNRIRKILCDNDGRLWVATCEGLNLYNPATDDFTRISLPYIEFNGYISDIYQQSNGRIVFIAAGIGIYSLDTSSGKPVADCIMPLKPGSSDFNTLCETRHGELIGSTHNGEIIKIASSGKTSVNKISESFIKILLKDSSGNIFIASTDKAWLWDGEGTEFHRITIPSPHKVTINCATATADGDIIAGTAANGIYRLPCGSRHMAPDSSYGNSDLDISHSNITALYEDSRHNLWAGCNRKGVILASSEKMPFSFINIEKLIPNQSFEKIKIEICPSSKCIWAASDGGLLLKLDETGNLIQRIKLNNPISSILIASNGKTYIGVDNEGLYEVTPHGSTKQLFGLSGKYLANSITEDRSGNIYLGMMGSGVAQINLATQKYRMIYDKSAQFNPIWVSSLLCDSHDRVWIGMYGGLMTYNPSTDGFIHLSALNPQMCKGVHNAIAEDNAGKIWSATSNGLFIINPEDYTYRRLTASDGLSDIFLSTITFDSAGNAWIGTRNEINRVDREMNITRHRPNKILKDFGYVSAVSDSNRIFFSSSKGITTFHADTLSRHISNLEIFITGIYLNNHKINAGSISDKTGKTIIGPSGDIHLSYADSHLSMRLSRRNFKESDDIVYLWRIPELSAEWTSAPQGSHLIALPHLEPGKYTVQIKGSSNGAESEIIESDVIISPPWYLIPTAKIIYSLLILIIPILAFLFVREKNIEKINNEKIKFFINVSHDLRSPLTLIMSPLEKIMKSEHDPETAMNLLAIHRNANRILNLINQLLYIRKLDKGKMELSYSTVNFTSYISEIIELFRTQAQENGIDLTFRAAKPQDHERNVSLDSENFEKIVTNLLSNALKFTPKGGSVDVVAGFGHDKSMGDFAEISVFDTGPGLDEKSIHHLFDRFYQGKNTTGHANTGFGIGLNLCRMLAGLHHGNISAANRKDCCGSLFKVRIPVAAKNVGTTSEIVRKPHPSLTTGELPAQKRRKQTRNKSLNILVVDDDTELCAYLCDALSAFGNASSASNGREALKNIVEKRPDIIISDIAMPEMDGISLLKAVKSNVDTSHIPVILLSSKNEAEDRMSGWDKGADCYIGKPFNIEELVSIIDNLIDNRLRLKGKFTGSQEHADKCPLPDMKGNDSALMDKIVEEINSHIGDPEFNVEKLCLEVGMSRAHLNRKMKDIFGFSPSDFIRNARLRRACELLTNEDIDISQIAYAVGFSSQAHFSNAFKRFSGSSPSEYRETALYRKQPVEP